VNPMLITGGQGVAGSNPVSPTGEVGVSFATSPGFHLAPLCMDSVVSS